MFIELVDSLRCLEPHEETWLVAAVTRMDGRHVAEGTLGCPLCRREYPIVSGVAWFATDSPEESDERLTTQLQIEDEARVMRAAALLDLTEPGGIVVLGGSYTHYADALAELGAGHVIVLNGRTADSSPQTVSSVVIDSQLPFGRGSVRAAALGREIATTGLLDSTVTTLRSKGRLIGPPTVSAPEGVTVLARDYDDWVAERSVVASPPVALRSVRRQP